MSWGKAHRQCLLVLLVALVTVGCSDSGSRKSGGDFLSRVCALGDLPHGTPVDDATLAQRADDLLGLRGGREILLPDPEAKRVIQTAALVGLIAAQNARFATATPTLGGVRTLTDGSLAAALADLRKACE